MDNAAMADALRRLAQRELDITIDEQLALECATRHYEAMAYAELAFPDKEQPGRSQ